MKLISIKLCNFRQFYGKTPDIMLASGNPDNTTIIHGNNGAGKTSLLNAFTWVLYEKFTSAFAEENQLINKRAIAEAQIGNPVECSVKLNWEHDGKRYSARRECRAYKNKYDLTISKTDLYLQIAGDDGEWYFPHEQPEQIISEILPTNLHQYFFFDGERIEKIVRSDKKAEISQATKMLLGIEVLELSTNHLKGAKKTLENELESIGDTQTKQLLKNQEKLENELNRLNERQQEITQELGYQQTLKKETSQRLLELSAAKELQERRQNLEDQKSANQENLKKNKEVLKRELSAKAYTVFLPEIVAEFREIVVALKAKGELTTGISKEFVNDLLHQKRCICGNQLEEGTHNHQQVQAWIDKAGIAAIEENAIRLSYQVDEIDKQGAVFWEKIDREQANISHIKDNIDQVETQLDKIQEKLRKDASEEIRSLQKRLDEIEIIIEELTLEKGASKQQAENIKKQIEDLTKKISKQKMNEEKQSLAQRRISATQEAIERLIEVENRQRKRFRFDLEKRVQEIFSEISVTPYLPKISEKYELTLVQNIGGIESLVAASSGENQILSLSFIGAIIDRVREWNANKIFMVPDSSTFPIVMDSPFGSLDENNRRQTAKIIPKLANQLVVLVTKTQWRGEVAEEMADRIGKQYVLIYYSSKPDCEEDTIDIDGMRYSLVRRSPNEFDYTEIVEVTDDF